jgi:hypothetical protein
MSICTCPTNVVDDRGYCCMSPDRATFVQRVKNCKHGADAAIAYINNNDEELHLRARKLDFGFAKDWFGSHIHGKTTYSSKFEFDCFVARYVRQLEEEDDEPVERLVRWQLRRHLVEDLDELVEELSTSADYEFVYHPNADWLQRHKVVRIVRKWAAEFLAVNDAYEGFKVSCRRNVDMGDDGWRMEIKFLIRKHINIVVPE